MNNLPEHIKRTLQSIDRIERAEASPFLFGKIMDKLKHELPEPIYYGTKMVVRFALTVLVIGALNAASVHIAKKQVPPALDENTLIQKAAQEYFGLEDHFNYNY
ncbi:MAG: hypothetical protein EAY81_06050 [Bacteroidetes bacterium]|nr:MAG: hypothetical protein EAY81_06050 [Bacteroidota bacterium]